MAGAVIRQPTGRQGRIKEALEVGAGGAIPAVRAEEVALQHQEVLRYGNIFFSASLLPTLPIS